MRFQRLRTVGTIDSTVPMKTRLFVPTALQVESGASQVQARDGTGDRINKGRNRPTETAGGVVNCAPQVTATIVRRNCDFFESGREYDRLSTVRRPAAGHGKPMAPPYSLLVDIEVA